MDTVADGQATQEVPPNGQNTEALLPPGVREASAEINQLTDLTTLLSNVDLTGLDRSTPLLVPGKYSVLINKMEVKAGKKEGTHNLNIELKLSNGANTLQGKPVNAGFVVFDLVSLTPTQGGNGKQPYNPAEKLADIQLATFGEQRKGFVPADYIGQMVTVTIKTEKEDVENGYPAKNRVARWNVKKAAQSLSSL